MERRRFLFVATVVPLGALAVPSAARANDDPPPVPDSPAPPFNFNVDPHYPNAVYLPIAPPTASGAETAKLVLRINIKNEGSVARTVTGISYAFPGAGVASISMKGVQLLMGNDGVIQPGAFGNFANGAQVQLDETTSTRNDVYLSLPVPPVLRIRISAAGYDYPATQDFALVPYEIAHRLPYWVEDLRPGECIQMAGVHGSGSNTGEQVYAHDVGVKGWDNELQAWSLVLPGAVQPIGTANTDHRIWNLPLRSVAPGTVKAAVDGIDDNLAPGAPVTSGSTYGNYVEVEHTNDTRTLYCHLRKGSVEVTVGQEVAYGDILGRVGHSGNSSHPHTHMEAKGKNVLWRWRPWALTESWLVAESELGAWDPGSPLWVPANGRGVPPVSTLVWPSSSLPVWYRPDIPEFIEIDFPPHIWVRFVERARRCGYEPVRFGAYEVDGRARAFSLFRPATGEPALARAGLSGAELAEDLDAHKRAGYRPVSLSSYVDDGLRYAYILRRDTGPEWIWYAGLRVEEHRARLESLRRDGYQPQAVEITIADHTVSVSAWYAQTSSTVDTSLLLSPREHQATVAAQAAQGRHLANVSATRLESGEPALSALFADQVGAAQAFYGLDRATLIRRQEALTRDGVLTRALAAYVQHGVIRFAGS